MTALMPTRLEAFDHHSQRKQQLRTRITCLKMPDPAYKAINAALIFNLSLEPALLYSLGLFADKGGDDHIVSSRTSFKLRDNALYFETDTRRYELTKWPLDAPSNTDTKYRLSVVVSPFLKDNSFMAAARAPLHEQHLESVIASDLDWSEL
jgi:hypothetical protein